MCVVLYFLALFRYSIILLIYWLVCIYLFLCECAYSARLCVFLSFTFTYPSVNRFVYLFQILTSFDKTASFEFSFNISLEKFHLISIDDMFGKFSKINFQKKWQIIPRQSVNSNVRALLIRVTNFFFRLWFFVSIIHSLRWFLQSFKPCVCVCMFDRLWFACVCVKFW